MFTQGGGVLGVNTEHGGRTKGEQLAHPEGRRKECREPGELSHSFIHSSKKFSWRAYDVPATLLDAGTVVVHKTDKQSLFS